MHWPVDYECLANLYLLELQFCPIDQYFSVKPFMSLGGNMRLSILVFSVVLLQGSWALSYERQLTAELLQEYSSSARPVKNVSYHPILRIRGVT